MISRSRGQLLTISCPSFSSTINAPSIFPCSVSKGARWFDQINGIESEGWPRLYDLEIEDWSGGLNRHFFWNKNSYTPAFSFIIMKFPIGVGTNANVPANIHRLTMAAAQITDAVFTYQVLPGLDYSDPEGFPGWPADGNYPVYDELVEGTENEKGWLGQPSGQAVRLAKSAPDLLEGTGLMNDSRLVESLSGDGIKFEIQDDQLVVESTGAQAEDDVLRFNLGGIETSGPDLTVFFKIWGEPLAGFPKGIARLAWLKAIDSEGKELGKFMTWVGESEYEASFYFGNIASESVELEWEVEGREPVLLSSLTAHAHPDTIYREFEDGLVVANPSPNPFEFDLESLLPGEDFRRIQGTDLQDPVTNNGESVGPQLTLAPLDALFLRKER